MDGVRWFLSVGLLIAVALTGCSGSSAPQGEVAKAPAVVIPADLKPEQVIDRFLAAVCKGDDRTAEALLTKLSVENTKKYDLQVAPQGSETAKYEVGECKLVGDANDQGAYVASKWTDIDDTGKPKTDEIVWMIHKEAEGWRIVGMGITPFEDLDVVYFNFEDPQDMLAKFQQINDLAIKRATDPSAKPIEPAPQGAVAAGAPGTGAPAPGTASQVPAGVAPPSGVAPDAIQAVRPGTTANPQLK